MAADIWDRVCKVLTDFEYLQARIGALPEQEGQQPPDSVFQLLLDFVQTLEASARGPASGRSRDSAPSPRQQLTPVD